jgi:hypothetical protein
MHWLITDKGDQDVRLLADGHYTRQTPGDVRFTRNGQNLVFVTADLLAGWVTFRPTPGKAVRPDGMDCWECAFFRNTGPNLSSELIREAEALSHALWGPPPRDGFVTLVQPGKIQSTNPGCCYLKADWMRAGVSSKGYLRFRAPIRPWHEVAVPPEFWRWRGQRGGKLRRDLEESGLMLAAA